ncbi:nucleoid-associated protein [Bacillus paranthracis]|uniref:nucleoid-associated protein n=1 Tax=Bacillus paranthracis TaxID=2026186 RepID=UPI003DA8D99F
MVDFTRMKISGLVVHRVGNKLKNDGIVVSKEAITNPSIELQEVLLRYFLTSFKNEQYFKFVHSTSLDLNEIYNYTKNIFKDEASFHANSVNILKHLYESSTHPNIKSGELYVVMFEDCCVDGEMIDAIGIFKSENKDIYLKVLQNGESLGMDFEKGINTKELDKGCIIFNIENEVGYKVAIVDKASHSEAMFWKNQFLSLAEYKDENYHTTNYINICTRFSKEIIKGEEIGDSTENMVFLSDTLDYFTNSEEFDLSTFANDVIRKPEYIEKFIEVKAAYEKEKEIEIQDNFNISSEALKKVKKKMNNHVKLDTNVEIKINRLQEQQFQFIEKGFDSEKGMYFYKIFYNREKGM